jgi:hypothetical protein
MAFRASLGVEPQLYEVESFHRTSNTYTLKHPVTEARLRSQAFASDLYIGEHTREIGDPILDPLRGVEKSTAPYTSEKTGEAGHRDRPYIRVFIVSRPVPLAC